MYCDLHVSGLFRWSRQACWVEQQQGSPAAACLSALSNEPRDTPTVMSIYGGQVTSSRAAEDWGRGQEGHVVRSIVTQLRENRKEKLYCDVAQQGNAKGLWGNPKMTARKLENILQGKSRLVLKNIRALWGLCTIVFLIDVFLIDFGLCLSTVTQRKKIYHALLHPIPASKCIHCWPEENNQTKEGS